MHLIIMGAPGSGKGTYAKVLKDIFAVPHISTGEMFRKAIKEGSELGKLAQSLIDKGNFVPDEITNELVKQRISEDDCKCGFLLDGYPRNLSNKGYVIIKGKKCPILGRVCMDQFVVDVTDIEDVKKGDIVTVIYDGRVMETYPLQIDAYAVYTVEECLSYSGS